MLTTGLMSATNNYFDVNTAGSIKEFFKDTASSGHLNMNNNIAASNGAGATTYDMVPKSGTDADWKAGVKV
jgi:hypothetical protein